jgi:hypothetical protein
MLKYTYCIHLLVYDEINKQIVPLTPELSANRWCPLLGSFLSSFFNPFFLFFLLMDLLMETTGAQRGYLEGVDTKA